MSTAVVIDSHSVTPPQTVNQMKTGVDSLYHRCPPLEGGRAAGFLGVGGAVVFSVLYSL